jgi:hypothetical protein
LLKQNLRVASDFKPFTKAQMERLRHRLAPAASDGRFELYKTTAQHEGDEGRAQHSFPSQDELTG